MQIAGPHARPSDSAFQRRSPGTCVCMCLTSFPGDSDAIALGTPGHRKRGNRNRECCWGHDGHTFPSADVRGDGLGRQQCQELEPLLLPTQLLLEPQPRAGYGADRQPDLVPGFTSGSPAIDKQPAPAQLLSKYLLNQLNTPEASSSRRLRTQPAGLDPRPCCSLWAGLCPHRA